MKKALVMKQDLDSFNLVEGQIFLIGEASEMDAYTWTHRDKMELVEIAADLEDRDQSELEAVYIENIQQNSEGEDVVIGTYDIKLNVALDKEKRIKEIYDVMTQDILDQMKIVFGTSSSESANAYKETFQMMLEDPSAFSGAGLTARFDVGSISAGDDLDTDAKITEYASGKMADIKAYGIYRMQRIEQFKSDKAAIEAE